MTISWSNKPVCNKCGSHLVLNGGVCECDLRRYAEQPDDRDILPLPVINFAAQTTKEESTVTHNLGRKLDILPLPEMTF